MPLASCLQVFLCCWCMEVAGAFHAQWCVFLIIGMLSCSWARGRCNLVYHPHKAVPSKALIKKNSLAARYNLKQCGHQYTSARIKDMCLKTCTRHTLIHCTRGQAWPAGIISLVFNADSLVFASSILHSYTHQFSQYLKSYAPRSER